MNNKRLLLIFTLVTICFASYAQDNIRLGFKFSPLFSSVRPTTDNYDKSATRLGFSYGVTGDFFFTDNYAFSTEFAITSLGGKIEYTSNDTTIKTNIKTNYIEIPLLLKLKTNDFPGGISVYGKFGLGMGINIKGTSESDYFKGNVKINQDKVNKANKVVQPFNLSLVIGGGIEYNISDNLGIAAGITYSNGFTNIINDDFAYKYPAGDLDATQSYLAINLGLLF